MLILTLALSLAACGGKDETLKDNGGQTVTDPQNTPDTKPENDPAPESTPDPAPAPGAISAEYDLTDSAAYGPGTAYEDIADIFSEEDMSAAARITVFGIAKVIKDGNGDPSEYHIVPVFDKTEPSEINRNSDGIDFYVLAEFGDIPADQRPAHGDIVTVTGVWKQVPDETAGDNYFNLFVESVENHGESTW